MWRFVFILNVLLLLLSMLFNEYTPSYRKIKKKQLKTESFCEKEQLYTLKLLLSAELFSMEKCKIDDENDNDNDNDDNDDDMLFQRDNEA